MRVLSRTTLPTESATFDLLAFQSTPSSQLHLAAVLGDVTSGSVLVRAHSECLTGDVFGSLRCDCGPQFRSAVEAVSAEGRGVLVYLRGHEGRGIGLLNKLRAYALQDAGLDTVDANTALGLPVDARDYRPAWALLAHIGVRQVRLLTNNPDKLRSLSAYPGFLAAPPEHVPMRAAVNPHNTRYLTTKSARLGHQAVGL
jgi:3,4-dihydroxy 2-butanone 4-phosphate synthase / GTP cyclohydrolase II